MTDPVISKVPPVSFGRERERPQPLRSCQLTANGRTAIIAGLRALGMPAGAMILVPEWHCGSEVDAILAAGGRPVLYRLDDNLNADLEDVEQKLRGLRPWGLYCTHFFGYPQPLEGLMKLAEAAGAVVIEDLALGLLSAGGRAPIGRSGVMTVYSLVKTLPLSDGGALWLRDGKLSAALPRPGIVSDVKGLRRLLRRRKQPSGPLKDKFAAASEADLDMWDPAAGISPDARLVASTRLTEALISRFDLDDILTQHRKNYEALWHAVTPLADVQPLMRKLPDEACPAYFPLWVRDARRATAALAAAGVESVRFWRRFHPGFGPEVSERLTALRRHVLRLPIHSGVTEASIARMSKALQNAERPPG